MRRTERCCATGLSRVLAVAAGLLVLGGPACRKGYSGTETAIDRRCPFIAVKLVDAQHDDGREATLLHFSLSNDRDQDVAIGRGLVVLSRGGKHLIGLTVRTNEPESPKVIPAKGSAVYPVYLPDRFKEVAALLPGDGSVRFDLVLLRYFVRDGDKFAPQDGAPPLLRATFVERAGVSSTKGKFRYKLANTSGKHIKKVGATLEFSRVVSVGIELYAGGVFIDVDGPLSNGETVELKQEVHGSSMPGAEDPLSLLRSKDAGIDLDLSELTIEYRDGTVERYF